MTTIDNPPTPEMQKTKNDGIFSLLVSIIKKNAELPEDVNLLATSVKMLADELKELSLCVTKITKTLLEHHVAITELYQMHTDLLQSKVGTYDEITPDIDILRTKRKTPQEPN